MIWLAVAAVAAAGFVATLAPATSAPTWAPAATAAIHPGVETFTNGSQCTANFVFTDGTNVYLGQAAHCSSTGTNTQVDGCSTPTLPIGTPVVILDAAHPGTLVYDSWNTMQSPGQTNTSDECAYNDLALVRVDPRDVGTVNPSIPHWGGPVGLNTGGTTSGSSVYSYGNSILRLGITLLSPKVGTSNGDVPGGWSHSVSTITPGIPGDSGSAFLDASGNALGDLSTVDVGVPSGVTNNVSDLAHELAYLHAHTSFTGVQLVPGTQPFNASQAPLDTAKPVDNPVGGLQNFLGI